MDTMGRTFICSVVFIDVVGYTRYSVARQVELKQTLMGLIAQSQAPIAEGDCIMLDTGDGAALGFLAGPEDAMFAAHVLVSGAHQVQPEPMVLRVGIHIGPVKRVQDINNRPNLIGDGINVAQRIMSFCEPGQVLVSRAYYEVIACLSDDYARLFYYEGVHHDKHVREHELYRLSFGADPEPEPAPSPAQAPEPALRVHPVPLPVEPPKPTSPLLQDQHFVADETECAAVIHWVAEKLGPLAKLLVMRAQKGVTDRAAWLGNVAMQLPSEARPEFAKVFAVPLAKNDTAANPEELVAAPAPQSGGVIAPSITAEERTALLAMATQVLGPIAKVVLKRAEQQGRSSLTSLVEALASQIDEPAARARFLDEAGRLRVGH